MSQFKGRMLKGKVGCGDEVRTQRLMHDKGNTSATEEWGQEMDRYPGGTRLAHLASSPPGCSQGSSP